MPARLFADKIPPQRIRTFLFLFGVALALPLLGIALFAFHQMSSLEEQELERRVQQVALTPAGLVAGAQISTFARGGLVALVPWQQVSASLAGIG